MNIFVTSHAIAWPLFRWRTAEVTYTIYTHSVCADEIFNPITMMIPTRQSHRQRSAAHASLPWSQDEAQKLLLICSRCKKAPPTRSCVYVRDVGPWGGRQHSNFSQSLWFPRRLLLITCVWWDEITKTEQYLVTFRRRSSHCRSPTSLLATRRTRWAKDVAIARPYQAGWLRPIYAFTSGSANGQDTHARASWKVRIPYETVNATRTGNFPTFFYINDSVGRRP